jgi:hypothetical protein
MVKCFDDHMKLLGYGITHPYFLFMFKQCGAEVLEFLYCFQDIDMGIPFGYPLLVYLARPNMEKTQYGEGPTRQPEEVVD